MPEFVAAGATAVELMVAPALMVASQHIPARPSDWMELPPESAALLVEFGADDPTRSSTRWSRAPSGIARLARLIRPPDFTRDPERIEVALDACARACTG